MILIISDEEDTQIYWVTYYLKKWDVPYVQFNVVDYPLRIEHTSKWNTHEHKQFIRIPKIEGINCSQIRSVWYRKPDLPKIPGILINYEQEYAYNECRQDLYGLYNYLQDRFWISPIYNMVRSGNKPLQLTLASKIGLSVPDTIITNNSDEAYRFFQTHEGNIVYKSLSDGILVSRRNSWERPFVHGEVYTTPLKGFDRSQFRHVGNCPCLFQEYVRKKFELRVTVVKEETFAAEIHSQENVATMHDWRRDELREITHKVHKLPSEIAEKCILLVKRLGLNFGAVDMIYTPNNEYIFLEINPNGQYGWIEERTGLKISEAIAKALKSGKE